MMKPILFVLFSTIFSVQSKITVRDKIKLIKEGEPFTLVCDMPLANWTFSLQNHKNAHRTVAHCENCPSSKCNVHENYKGRITAFCSQKNSILHFNSTRIDDSFIDISCPENDLFNGFYVGKDGDRPRSGHNSPFALSQKNFTLVCDLRRNNMISWMGEQGELLSSFNSKCYNHHSKYDRKRFEITCDKKQKKSILHIKNITVSDDGKTFSCGSGLKDLFVFRLTVNVPVKNVSIFYQNEVLVEDEVGIFICKVAESKPEASFQWVIIHHNGSQKILQKSIIIPMILERKLFRTISILKLKLKRDYQKIMCKATIENLPWTNSEYQSLDIKHEKISTDSTNDMIASWLGSTVFAIISLIIAVIVCIKYWRFSRNNRNHTSANDTKQPEGHEMTDMSVYSNAYDVPRRPVSIQTSLYDDAVGVSINQRLGDEIQPQYIDMGNNTSAKGQGNGIQPFYLEILDRAPVTDCLVYENMEE